MKGVATRSVVFRPAEGLKSDGVRRAAGTIRAKPAIRESTQACQRLFAVRTGRKETAGLPKLKWQQKEQVENL